MTSCRKLLRDKIRAGKHRVGPAGLPQNQETLFQVMFLYQKADFSLILNIEDVLLAV